MTAVRSALVVLGSVLIEADRDTRRRRARWLGALAPACWRCAEHRALAEVIADGADDVPAFVEAMSEYPVWRVLELLSRAEDAACTEVDRWREHAELLVAEGRVERMRWALAEHREPAA